MEKKISIYHQLSAIYNELVLMDEDSINEVVEMLKGIFFKLDPILHPDTVKRSLLS